MPDKIATYKIINDSGGSRYSFFCDLSGAKIFTSEIINESNRDEELKKVWEIAKKEFNRCEKCGRFVCDAMYNADTLKCVDCSPWENPPNFCKRCGEETEHDDTYCRKCGSALRYEEE